MLSVTFSRRLLSLATAERNKLSKYTVSKRSGVSQSMLSLVERGLRNPTLELTLRIADGIGVDLTVLIKKARGWRFQDKQGSVQGGLIRWNIVGVGLALLFLKSKLLILLQFALARLAPVRFPIPNCFDVDA